MSWPARLAVLSESIEADFDANTWTLRPLTHFKVGAGLYLSIKVGAGLYLSIPVDSSEEATEILDQMGGDTVSDG